MTHDIVFRVSCISRWPMVDIVGPKKRSEIMRRVRSKDTGPELALRRYLHSKGLRYRLHVKELPGQPDIVFPARRSVILVHGCFWHGHDCRRGRNQPKSRLDYWRPKIEANRNRDERVAKELRRLGWRVLVVWECEALHPSRIYDKIARFLKLGTNGGKKSK